MIYGRYTAGGGVEEATICILTGRTVSVQNSVRESVTGTPYFYRVISSQYHRVTDELRAQWRTNAPQTKKGKE